MKSLVLAAARFLALPLLLALPLVVARPASATVLVPLDTEALTTRSDRVVLGTVIAQESRWSDGHEAIYTEAKVRVTKVYKGATQPGEIVMVRREGGSAGGLGMRVFGAANFVVGEEVLMFLEQRGVATWTVGMAQGKLGVVTGSDGIKRVAPELSGVAWEHAPNARVKAALLPRRLDDVEREIQSYTRSSK